MKPAFRRAAAGLVVVLLLAGCGPQAQDEDNLRINNDEDEEEQVYIFPDGTVVHGDESKWVKDVEAFLSRWIKEPVWSPVESSKGIRSKVEAGMAKISDGFIYLGTWLTSRPDEQKTIWLNPDSRQLLQLTTWQESSPSAPTNTTPSKPICSQGDEALKFVPDMPEWIQTVCTSDFTHDGMRVQLFVVNVSETDTSKITNRIYRVIHQQ